MPQRAGGQEKGRVVAANNFYQTLYPGGGQ
jgi:hypothetical protein